jgi:hypothetical protein
MRWLASPLAALLLSAPAARAADDFFTTEVRPILARHCFKCHGPDEGARKSRLRLDVRAEALKPARSRRRAIVPGKPEKSELIERIFAEVPSEVMPPPAAKLPLTDKQKQVLKRWIAAGAPYATHWAFVAPRPLVPPMVKQSGWVRNPLDRFVLARLEKEGLKPAAEADRLTLARRVWLDLVGVPPTPEEADAFASDVRPDAYERLVDRLLASPLYGERWARRWLDLARYADTNGYEKDRARSIWPYRDWVIAALNANLPFDRFTIEQLAGDMLPGATLSQRIATGFHRNTMLNEEGGIDPLEFRFHAVTDRVATTGTAWLGLTTGCAQCHTHKFDPLTHREYYSLLAFLDNADEPAIEVPDARVEARRRQLHARIDALIARLPERFPVPDSSKQRAEDRREHLEKRFGEWVEAQAKKSVRWVVLSPAQAKANLPLLTVLPDGSVLASGDQSKSDTYDLLFRTELHNIRAIRLEALPDERLPGRGPGRVYYEGPPGDFHLSELTVTADGRKVALKGATHSFAAGGSSAAAAIDGNPQTGWSINGGQGRAHTAVFTLAEPLGEVKELRVRLLFERYYSAGLGRFRLWVTTDTAPAAARDLPAEAEQALLIPTAKRTPAQEQLLLREFLLRAPELARARAEIDRLRKQMPRHPTTLVFAERPRHHPRPTHLHRRGEFLQPAERVSPDVPSFLPPLPKGALHDRLHFARWLVSAENPLTARVTVNRHWAVLFGRGIVPTVHDFGYAGELPSHPELLDWLAREFMRSGWSVKAFHRLIVTSATYRQSSIVTAVLERRDPDNRLLARGPRHRLEAEQIRDSTLAVSGLLAVKVGGPSVFPPQPPGVTTEGAYGQLQWKVSTGLDRYRRGLYTFTKRTAPFAMSATFDGPSGEVCLAKREASNTPLQALTLLNDPAMTEAAQALGRRMASASGSVEERVRALFRRVLIRHPSRAEATLLMRFLTVQRGRFERKELDTAAVAGPGAGDITERAAWTALARVLLNLDEAITKG